MTTIAGASGFLNAATLANVRGVSAVQPSVLGEGGIGAVDLLDIGRASAPRGIGLSPQARALNKTFLESSTSQFNALFSLGVGTTASIEGLQQQILALRSSVPESALSDAARELLNDDGGVSQGQTGQEVDTQA